MREIAKTSAITAELDYFDHGDAMAMDLRYANFELMVKRRGGGAFRAALKPSQREYGTMMPGGWGSKDGRSIVLRHLEPGREPEVLLNFYWGGAHCCYYSYIFRYSPAKRTYLRLTHLWGDVAPRLRDLNGDGVTEVQAADDRFAYAFTDFADSAFPVQIWRLGKAHLVDATDRYPALIRKDADSLWTAYLRGRSDHGRSLRGVLAAFLADKYRLNEAADGWRLLRQAASQGDFTHQDDGATEGVDAYFQKLQQSLQQWGYGDFNAVTHTVAVSTANYVQQMQSVGRSLSTSLNALGAAKSARQAASDLQRVQSQLRAAAQRVHGLIPPSPIKTEHAALVKAIGDLADELGPIISKLQSGNISALSAVPTLSGLAEIKTASTEISNKGYPIGR